MGSRLFISCDCLDSDSAVFDIIQPDYSFFPADYNRVFIHGLVRIILSLYLFQLIGVKGKRPDCIVSRHHRLVRHGSKPDAVSALLAICTFRMPDKR